MLEDLRRMPRGVAVVVAFGLVLLGGLGLTLPLVISQAIDAPVSPVGIVWMLLIAYLVFTLTLVLQRKQAGWGLAIGMASLVVPLTLILWQWASAIGALAGVAIGAVLFLSLRNRRSRGWFSET
jgi:ABC-type multidrug transport system fused ATPase/permease subunit